VVALLPGVEFLDEEMMSLKVTRCADYSGSAVEDARELFRDSGFARRVRKEVRLLPWGIRPQWMKVDRDRRLQFGCEKA
jgi:hypothetical protein